MARTTLPHRQRNLVVEQEIENETHDHTVRTAGLIRRIAKESNFATTFNKDGVKILIVAPWLAPKILH